MTTTAFFAATNDALRAEGVKSVCYEATSFDRATDADGLIRNRLDATSKLVFDGSSVNLEGQLTRRQPDGSAGYTYRRGEHDFGMDHQTAICVITTHQQTITVVL